MAFGSNRKAAQIAPSSIKTASKEELNEIAALEGSEDSKASKATKKNSSIRDIIPNPFRSSKNKHSNNDNENNNRSNEYVAAKVRRIYLGHILYLS